MNLTATTHSLELVTAAAQDIDYVLSWTDIDKSGALTVALPGSSAGTITTATTTTVVSAPASDVYRAISHASFCNAGAGSQTVTVQRDVAGSNRRVLRAVLAPDECLKYERGRGWYLLTANGEVATVGATGADGLDGAVAVQEVTIDFGASSVDVATVTVTDAGILSTSLFLCGISGGSTSDNNADAHALMAEMCRVTAVPAAGSVTFTARLYGLRATGTFKLRYVYSS